MGAVGELEKRETQRCARGGDGSGGGRLGQRSGAEPGQKRFEGRQGNGRADPAQKIPAAETVITLGGKIAISGG